MVAMLDYWINLYQTHRDKLVALDIETTKYNGEISVIGISRRRETFVAPVYEEIQLVKSKSLTGAAIRWALKDSKVLLTFNGKKFDIPKIEKEFPGAIPPGLKMIDLYLLAKQVGMSSDLKALEKTFSIRRPAKAKQRGRTAKLWNNYNKKEDGSALRALLGYNKYDARNLFDLADQLIYWAILKKKDQDSIRKAISESRLV